MVVVVAAYIDLPNLLLDDSELVQAIEYSCVIHTLEDAFHNGSAYYASDIVSNIPECS